MDRAVRELSAFVAIPSVSADPRRAGDVRRAAVYVADALRSAGVASVRIEKTAGAPVVIGSHGADPRRPTVLVYGHYDVQPPGPANAWRSDPFQPVVRDGSLVGRGASDDKGQLWIHVEALRRLLGRSGTLPVNLRMVVEGDEEVGSPHLGAVLRAHRRELAPDVVVVSDTRFAAGNRPALTYSLRGQLSVEIGVVTARAGAHSGRFGGAALAATDVLTTLLTRLRDGRGRLRPASVYDDVVAPTPAERAFMAAHGPADGDILSAGGTAIAGPGEAGWSLYERVTVRPALTVTRLESGIGAGAAVPARATARLDVRLVPRQHPARVFAVLRDHLVAAAPAGAAVEVRCLGATRAVEMPRRHPALQAAAASYRTVFGAAPVWLRSGGTIPVVGHADRLFGVPTVLLGFGAADDRAHAANEHFPLALLSRGIATVTDLLVRLGALGSVGIATCQRPLARRDLDRPVELAR
jgi:acetylornithine deacetylase/succinyl-diaminopimelate desuccinylase-like protein